jgi:hypothetical protein
MPEKKNLPFEFNIFQFNALDHGPVGVIGDPKKDFCRQVFFESTLSLVYKSGCLTFLRGGVFEFWGKKFDIRKNNC